MVRERRTRRDVRLGAGIAASCLLHLCSGVCAAQFAQARGSTPVPVYADDSTSARDALARLGDLIAGGNEGEAVRSLQRLLDEAGDRVLEVSGDDDLFISVREHVHRRLLDNPELLERYRRAQEPEAARALERGELRAAERSRLLTPSGYEAALRVAQLELEAARFESARFALLQLEEHPDRRGRSGEGAARLMGLLARYIDRPEVREAAGRWAAEAGLDTSGDAEDLFERPPGAASEAADPTSRSPLINLDEIVAKPIQSVPLVDEGVRIGLGTPASSAWALPAIVGEEIFINDGLRVISMERFTLAHRWTTPIADGTARTQAQPDRLRRRQARPVQPRGVAVGGGLVFASSGHGPTHEADPPEHVVALSRRTGEMVWSFHPSEAMDTFAGAETDGIVRHDEGTVIFAAQIRPDDRRLWSYRLFGLEADTGAVRWSRLIGTAGSVGWNATPVRPTIQRVRHGVVYRSDSFGLISAIEAATGRVRWVRRHPVEAYGIAPDMRPALAPAPEFFGDRMVVMSGDSRAILVLDPATGELLHSIDATLLGSPAMVLPAGDKFGVLGDQRVLWLDADDPDPTGVELGPRVTLEGLTGRPTTDGERLLLPMASGIGVLDPGRPERIERVELQRAGVILATDGQVLVSTPDAMHSFLVWETAERTLASRLSRDEHDPEPALILAELAYLAGRESRIEPAVAELQDRLGSLPEDRGRETRRRAFRVVLEMLEPTGRRAERPMLPTAIRTALVPHLLSMASSPEERVSGLLAKGALAESTGDAPGALDVYQEILGDSELAHANWRGPGAVLRAEMETTRRIRRVLGASGGGLYEVYEREARRLAGALGENADPSALADVASRYPASEVAPGLWLSASEQTDREHEAERWLHASMDALIERARAGMEIDRSVASEVGGRLAGTLLEQRRPEAASRVLDRIDDALPGLRLTSGGEAIEAEALRGRVAEVLGDLAWRPRIGGVFGEAAEEYRGGRLLAPMLSGGAPVAPGYAVMLQGDRLVLLEPGGGAGRTVSERWSRPGREGTELVRADREGVVIREIVDGEARISRLSARDGQEIWSRRIDGDLLAGAPDTRVMMPTVGEVRLSDVVAASTDRTLVLARRQGEATAIDIDSGRTLWGLEAGEFPLHSVGAGSGVVALGGQDTSLQAAAGVSVLDERSGEPIASLAASELAPGGLRWMRLTDPRVLAIGLEDRVVVFDLARGERMWAHADGEMAGSVDAWVSDGRLLVLTPQRGLAIAELSTGERIATLDPQPALISARPVSLVRMGEHDALVSQSGLLMLNQQGEVVGRDAASGAGALDSYAGPGVGAEAFVLVDRGARGGSARRVRIADTTGRYTSEPAALTLSQEDEPERAVVLEGVVLVQTRLGVIALPAPVDGVSG